MQPKTDRGGREERSLTDFLPVGILRTDPRGRCVALNPHGSELLGLPEEQALGSGWLDALEPDAREELTQRWKRGTEEGGLFEERLTVRLPDGTSRVALCRVTRLLSGSGAESGFLAALLDVTEWQKTGEALRKATRELEARVRELDCLFEISRAVERSAGSLPRILRDAVDILSRTWDDRGMACARIVLDGETYQSEPFDPGPHTLKAEILVQGRRAGEVEIGFPSGVSPEERGIPEADQPRLLEVVSQRLGRTAERVMGRQLLREKEEEVRERITHLTRVSTMGEMASSIAHEVNQPLTAIATYAQACRRLMEGGTAEESRVMEVLQHIAEEALRAGNIIHRLKDMVRRRESRWTECDLNALILDLQQLASADARLHDVVLSFHLAPDLPSILVDGVQVQQVVLNLIRNGIDAVEGGGGREGEVVVRTERAGPKAVRVSVEDNGEGLSPDQERMLFQPFFTTKEGGMGMGLSISKSIATAHKGRISFSRNPSRGMTFHLTLPAFDER